MNFSNGNLRLAYESIRTTKFRSTLTMLGIIIGVVAVILVVCIGEGVKRQIGQQVVRYGDNVVVVRPLSEHRGILGGDSVPAGAAAPLTLKDIETVRRLPAVAAAVPLSSVSGSIKGDRQVNTPLVIATTPEFATFIKPQLKYGGFFEASQDANQVVLGSKIVSDLYNDSMPLGQTLSYRGQEFLVAGVFKNFNAPPLSIESNFNNAVFIPYDTVRNLTGVEPSIYEVLVRAKPGTNMPAFARSVQATLVQSHGGAEDVAVSAAGKTGSGTDQTLRLLTLLTMAAAVIAFVVGGVGIMNMMFVTVTERIHEIGIRKAIGATNRQILKQFIAEAFVISCLGAVYGVVAAFAGIGLLRLYTSLQPIVVWPIVIIAPLVAIASGVLFGSIPAIKAARKDPIQALRHE